jgi:citrate lyase beta subunit
VNGLGTGWGRDALAAVANADAVLVPKVETAEAANAVRQGRHSAWTD